MKVLGRVVIVFLALVLILPSLVACGGDDDNSPQPTETDHPAEPTEETVSGQSDEPPANLFLADSPWAMTHRNPYCQGSSPFPGPTAPLHRGMRISSWADRQR